MLASATFGSPHLSETAAQGIISMMDPTFAKHISCNEMGSVGSLERIKSVLVRNFPVVRWLETLLQAYLFVISLHCDCALWLVF